ncbi:hypothetical protein [Burkholderia glumae]|uniref:hypothetical protein n=1 Tax=Burkholderia glumae TaxID=337 RepID=UPI00214A06F2|nr:hypothetical protein [Burkholderia glumae]MCR1767725.1 hypothetical protein [Burkholderia glumae]
MNQRKQPHNERSLASGIPAALMPAGITRYWEIGEHHELMQQLQSFLDTVLETNQIPFDIRHQYGRELAVRNPVGVAGYRSLSGFLPSCGLWMDLYWPQYAYSADMRLFFECFMRHPFAQLFGYGEEVGIVDQAVAANFYNDFVVCLRTEVVRCGVRKTLADARANLRDQAASIGRYLGELVSQHKHLVPIRVDFYYQQDAFDASDAMLREGWAVTGEGVWTPVPSTLPANLGRPETHARFDTAVAMAHRDSFIGNRRGADRHLFDRMAGYVCKLEQGGRSGANHFHCVFLIDPRGLSYADIQALKFGLGDRWRRVTAGQGIMFDCHDGHYRRSIEARYPWAIDRLDCSDAVQVARFIDYIVGYFAKDDGQAVRVKHTPRAQTLTKGR